MRLLIVLPINITLQIGLLMKRTLLFLSMLLSFSFVCAAEDRDSVAYGLIRRVADNVTSDADGVESLNANLYVREHVSVDHKNLLLNVIPTMTRFDRGENEYLAELFYEVSCIYNSLPRIKRVASLSTFARSSGEMDKVLFFMAPQIYGERLFGDELLSPLYPSNLKYYNYCVDTTFKGGNSVKLLFEARFDNIKLFTNGWVVVSTEDMLPQLFFASGWDEQCSFSVECRMGASGLERFVVRDIKLDIEYAFARNKLDIEAEARFDYTNLQPRVSGKNLERDYNLSVGDAFVGDTAEHDCCDFAVRYRKWPLSENDSLLYRKKGINSAGGALVEPADNSGDIKNMLWLIGDKAISSHSLAWGNSDLKMSPILNPSYLSYSTSRGLAYKLSFRFRKRLTQRRAFELRPMLGYNFKQKEVYWRIAGSLDFNQLKRSALVFDVGRESSLYSSIMLDDIEETSLDTLNFSSMPFVYYRDFHVKGDYRFEVANGLELRAGLNLYKRTMSGNAVGLEINGTELKENYRQFAPHLMVTWHPGMYYYISGGRKINMGSRAPRFALDVEQGIKGVLGSQGVYTRAELDMQYMHSISSSASLYMRLGAGGFFYTKDLYFVNYAFLKNNNLPLDKDDELSGAFQLLDAEWYNSANKYVRASFAYESPFLFLQKIIPSARIIESEALYSNILFISHLCPYFECGYGVDTPYINTGVFISFENYSYHRLGFKIAFSLFRN